jgi:hypothetical protein
MRVLRRLAVLALLIGGTCLAQDSRAARQAAMETISAADLERHLKFLAADEMRGRSTPSKELAAAARYLAEQFEKAGAKPAAPGGGFLQKKKTPVVAIDLAAARATFSIGSESHALTPGGHADFAVRGSGSVELDLAPVRTVSARDLVDDGSAFVQEAGDGLQGVVLLVTLDEWTRTGDPLDHCLARAERVGAAGCILVAEGWRPPPGLRELRRAKLEAQRGFREGGRALCAGFAIEDEGLAKSLRKAVAEAGADSRPGVRVSAKLETVKSDAEVSNVVAMIEAAPGPRAEEAVIFTAHYDHIGTTMPVAGDWICNGADDDGSGTVSRLELAQAFAAMKPAPARRLLFCAFFGEERGLLGSRFYVENPAHPLDKTVCNVNLEMIGRSFGVGPKVAWVTGWDYSDLGAILAEGGAAIGVKIIADPYPKQNYFLRSDNVSFVRHKVPGHTVSAGSTHADYHGVNDEVDRIEFPNMEAIVRAVFLGAAPIADGSKTVRWTREVPRLR